MATISAKTGESVPAFFARVFFVDVSTFERADELEAMGAPLDSPCGASSYDSICGAAAVLDALDLDPETERHALESVWHVILVQWFG